MSIVARNKLSIRDLDLFYGEKQALKKINMDIKENKVTALIGPSGCGKSTFLRTLNRMNDLIEGVKINGVVEVDGEDILVPHIVEDHCCRDNDGGTGKRCHDSHYYLHIRAAVDSGGLLYLHRNGVEITFHIP